MPSLLLAGHFGAGNIGDDAILAGFADGMSRYGDFELTAMSDDPQDTYRNTRLRSIPRKNMNEFSATLEKCDALVFAGGSIFQDVTSVRSAVFYATLIKKAKKAGKKVILVGQGVGPLTKFLSKRAATGAFNLADTIVVRDPASMQLLRDMGVKRPVKVGADLAFLMSPMDAVEQDYGLADRKTIGIAPKSFGKNPKEATALFGEFTRMVFQASYMPLMIGMDRNEDVPLIQAISDSQGGKIPDLRKVTRPQDLQARIKRMSAVVSVRLHGGVLAASAGTPVFLVNYDPKVSAFAKEIEAPSIGLEGLTPTRLFENFQQFMKNHDRHAKTIELKRGELLKRAELNIEAVVECLKGAAVAV